MRSGHRGTVRKSITSIRAITRRANACARSSNIRFCTAALISRDRAAAAKPSNLIRSVIQSSNRVRRRIERRRIGHRGTSRSRVARSYYHLDTSSFLSFNSGLQLVADNATLRSRATPGVDCNIRRFGRVAFGRRAVEWIRRQEKFHTLDVSRRRAIALVHVPAADPFCTGRHSDLISAAIVADRCAGCVRAVEEIITRLLRIVPARIAHTVMDGIVPVKVVIGVGSVPAAVVRLERVMRPTNTSVSTGDDNGFPLEPERPYVGCVCVSNPLLDRRRRAGLQW